MQGRKRRGRSQKKKNVYLKKTLQQKKPNSQTNKREGKDAKSLNLRARKGTKGVGLKKPGKSGKTVQERVFLKEVKRRKKKRRPRLPHKVVLGRGKGWNKRGKLERGGKNRVIEKRCWGRTNKVFLKKNGAEKW